MTEQDIHENDKLAGGDEKPKQKSGMTLWLSIAVAATVLGSPAQFGYNMGVINAPEATIKDFYISTYKNTFNEDLSVQALNLAWSVTVAVYAIGGMIGSASAGFVANKLGRKQTLLCNNAFAATGGAMFLAAGYMTSYPALLFLMIGGRVIVGINAGVNTIVAPMYVAEISPVELRGTLGTLFQFGVVLALAIGQVLGLPMILGNEKWNILLALTIVPAIFQLAVMFVCPESPRYMFINKNDKTAAKLGLQKFRGREDVSDDMDALEMEANMEAKAEKFTVKQLLTSYNLREPLIIALTLQVAQQLSGINAVNFYSTTIFKEAQMSDMEARFATVGTGISQLLMIIPTVFLMDRLGRRTLMLFGLGGMCIFSGLVVLFTLLTRTGETVFIVFNVIALFGIMGSFSIAPGPVPWLITAELFNQAPRAAAMSLAGATNWIMTFAVGLAFEHVLHYTGDYTFLIFMVLDYVFWVFVFMRVPETKNRSIDDIVESFNARADARRGITKGVQINEKKSENGDAGMQMQPTSAATEA